MVGFWGRKPPFFRFWGVPREMRKNARKCTKMHKNAHFSGFPFFLEGRPRPESPPNNTLISNPPRRNSGRVKWKFGPARPPAADFRAPAGPPGNSPAPRISAPKFGPRNSVSWDAPSESPIWDTSNLQF